MPGKPVGGARRTGRRSVARVLLERRRWDKGYVQEERLLETAYDYLLPFDEGSFSNELNTMVSVAARGGQWRSQSAAMWRYRLLQPAASKAKPAGHNLRMRSIFVLSIQTPL
jgi:hypothetical protein